MKLILAMVILIFMSALGGAWFFRYEPMGVLEEREFIAAGYNSRIVVRKDWVRVWDRWYGRDCISPSETIFTFVDLHGIACSAEDVTTFRRILGEARGIPVFDPTKPFTKEE